MYRVLRVMSPETGNWAAAIRRDEVIELVTAESIWSNTEIKIVLIPYPHYRGFSKGLLPTFQLIQELGSRPYPGTGLFHQFSDRPSHQRRL